MSSCFCSGSEFCSAREGSSCRHPHGPACGADTSAQTQTAAAAADPLRRVPVEAPAALAPARGPVTGAHEGQDPALVGCSGSQPSHVCECVRESVCVCVCVCV